MIIDRMEAVSMQLGQIILTAVNAILPIILLILLGYILRQKNFVSKEFVKIGNKLTFKVFLPCSMFINVYGIESFSSINWDVVIYCVAIVVVIFLLGMGTAVAATSVPERRGVILQCTFRSNFAIIGLPLAAALGSPEATAVAAIVSAFTIPVYNILAVIALSIYVGKGESGKSSIRSILLNIVKNPIILGVVAGLVCLVIRSVEISLFGKVVFSIQRDLKFIHTAVKNLSSLASPFALVVLGGQFVFSAVKGLLKEITIGIVWRIVLAPVIGLGCAILLNKLGILSCGANEYPALLALFGSPVAVSSAIMAEQMHNDEQLATQLVVWTSICSIVTIFAFVCVLMGMGLLVV